MQVPQIPTIPTIYRPFTFEFPSPKTKKFPLKTKRRATFQVYQPFIRRRGRFIPVGRPSERGRALRTGEFFARRTAAATFKVEPVKGKAVAFETKYIPPKEFRGFKVVKGQRVPMANEFIQLRRYRISSPGEKREIQQVGVAARRAQKIKWI